jgi:putative redox protein
MTQTETTTGGVAQEAERLHSIHVSTEYRGRYQSVSRIRDLPDVYIDEPVKLGGQNTGPTALESTLAALNACSAMIMYILRKEMRFDMQAVRFETEGVVDARSVEMRRTGKKYSEIAPITEHYQRVIQTIYVKTSESGERFEHFKSEVLRLCPMHALLRDAGVPTDSRWIIES